MANKLLMRWISAFTHSAFSSVFISCQGLALNDFSQCFVSDIVFSEIIADNFSARFAMTLVDAVNEGRGWTTH